MSQQNSFHYIFFKIHLAKHTWYDFLSQIVLILGFQPVFIGT